MRSSLVVLCAVLTIAGCREGDGPADPSVTDARVYLASSPNGAQIIVDDRNTGQTTPDTVALRRGDRSVVLRLDSAGFTYEYAFILEVERTDEVGEVTLPLGVRCLTAGGTCFQAARRHRDAANLRFATSAVGSLFHWGGSGSGIFWPAATQNSYASAGIPLFGAEFDGDSAGMGMYDQALLVGRPAPRVTVSGGGFRLEQEAWVLPQPAGLSSPTSLRGILIGQEIIGRDDIEGVLVLRLTYRNVSDDPLVHLFAPHIPDAAVTYTNAWIGFALDADIGAAADDWLSYDADMDMVFAYDADFATAFVGADADAPGLVGLRVLEAPAGTNVMLNSWSSGFDWNAGRSGEHAGFGMLSGSSVFAPAHAHTKIGHLPPAIGDIRMSVTAGPITLEPGAEVRIVIAVAVAPPVAGTFTSGVTVSPGDPLDTSRQLYNVAGILRARMTAAEALAGI
ncbi:MAG: PEGA domain-containing protein [Gemmatimonadetes bacterium]|nr:PEGA domain-containing protein [Gemmatimonadota bacterium]